MRNMTKLAAAVAATVAVVLTGAVAPAASGQPSTAGVAPQAIGVNVLIGNRNSGKCLEVLNYSTANNAPVGQYTCYGGANQLWSYNTSTGLIQNRHSGKCLEVLNFSTADAAPVGQYTCDGATSQQWNMNASNGLLANRHSGKCLEVYYGSTADFARMVQWPCHGGPHQTWRW